MYIVSATLLLASGSSVNQKFLSACYWSHLLVKSKMDSGQDAEANVWNWILLDMDVLRSGVHPHKDWEGNDWPLGSTEHAVAGAPLANGFIALLWILKGDLEYFASVLGLEHWSNGDRPCMACKVDRDRHPWTDHRTVGALHLQWTPAEWLQSHRPRHALWQWGGLGHWSSAFDTMRVLSLGVAQHV